MRTGQGRDTYLGTISFLLLWLLFSLACSKCLLLEKNCRRHSKTYGYCNSSIFIIIYIMLLQLIFSHCGHSQDSPAFTCISEADGYWGTTHIHIPACLWPSAKLQEHPDIFFQGHFFTNCKPTMHQA